jgi:uncharacterized membrane protein
VDSNRGGIVTGPGPYGAGDPTWSQPGQPAQPAPAGYGTQGSFIPQQPGSWTTPGSTVGPEGQQQYPTPGGYPSGAYPAAGYPVAGYPAGTYPAPGYPAYAMPIAMPRNGMGTAALVLGILAVVFCWAYWVGVVLGVLAIIFGGVGVARANAGQATNRSSALAGLILGIVAIAAFIVLVLLVWQALVAFT